MKKSKRRGTFFSITIVALLLTMIIPVTAFGDRRGRGRGRNLDGRKCGKFVNCHDARDGRWDGRGPRRRISGSSLRRRIWRNRNWDRDDDFRRRRVNRRVLLDRRFDRR